jgi:hypothetical protein
MSTVVALNAFQGSEDPADKRRCPRRRQLKDGKVVLSNWTTIDCTIRDVSDTGVRLTFGAPTGLPDAFKLLFVSGHSMRDVKTVWQRGLAAGIEFLGPEYQAPSRKF